jgi:hypothetical protein
VSSEMGTTIIIQEVPGLRPDRRKANLAPFLLAIQLNPGIRSTSLL